MTGHFWYGLAAGFAAFAGYCMLRDAWVISREARKCEQAWRLLDEAEAGEPFPAVIDRARPVCVPFPVPRDQIPARVGAWRGDN